MAEMMLFSFANAAGPSRDEHGFSMHIWMRCFHKVTPDSLRYFYIALFYKVYYKIKLFEKSST